MPDLRMITHRAMRSIVKEFGCYDAVAEVLNSRWGCGASKGTISKKMSGQLDWTLPDVIALQDAAGEYPITRLLARQKESHAVGEIACLVVQSGIVAKESGEAISAILDAEHSSSADDRAQAVTEIDQAIEALKLARTKLTEGEDAAGKIAHLAGVVSDGC
ncbi:MAG: hypothetical protein ACPGNV_14175 [Mangrovicoccus sp.]